MIIANSIDRIVFYPQLVDGAVTLDDTYFYSIINCVGSSSYPIVLPVPSTAGILIAFEVNTDPGVLITIDTLNGILSFGNGECITFVSTDSGGWFIQNINWQQLYFSASMSSSQVIANNSLSTLVFDNTIIDYGSFFDTGTYTYTPKYPGAYEFTLNVYMQAVSAATTCQINVRMNGTTDVGSTLFRLSSGNDGSLISVITPPIIMDGVTDNVLATITQVSGAPQTVDNTSAFTNFSGKRINYI